MSFFAMRRFRHLMLLSVVICGLMPPPATAAFVGPYDPANFTATHTESDGTWVLNLDGSLTLVGPNNGSGNPGSFTFLILATANGLVSFNWSYATLDAATFDRGGYSLTGTPVMLGDVDGASGSASFSVSTGDQFGFWIESDDNTGEPGILTISDFSAPGIATGVPEPSSLALMIGGLIAGVTMVRARRTGA